MQNEKQFTEVATLVGDRSRATMLWHLLDGRAFTATELSVLSEISAQSTSNHLSLLVKANLLSVEKLGRHRYYRFANDEVAHAIESLASLVGPQNTSKKIVQEPEGIKYARTCYDHLAGKIAVDIGASLVERKLLRLTSNQFALIKEIEKRFSMTVTAR